MKLAKLRIENFRQIEDSGELNFLDSLDRVRPFSLLVGPNGCGKTTILDAIACAFSAAGEVSVTRPGFDWSPHRIVRKGANSAKVTCTVLFSSEEMEATNRLVGINLGEPSFPPSQVVLKWTYPGSTQFGYVSFSPAQFRLIGTNKLFRARRELLDHLSKRRIANFDLFQRIGSVFTFDQQRSALSKSIRSDVWNVLHPDRTISEADGVSNIRAWDPRTILLDLAIRDRFATLKSGPDQYQSFQELKRLYESICKPRQIVGAFDDEVDGLVLILNDGKNDYRFEDASSGEQMVLLLLTQMVTERINQSIVLIDEIELHQHPVWQRRLLHLLPQMGTNNQIIATSHSDYVRDAMPPHTVMWLGDLREKQPVEETVDA